jgi:hypothetical protein
LKIILHDFGSIGNETTFIGKLNENNERIEDAIENTLSRDGTAPNEMLADLDMNDQRILNLPAPASDTEPVRLMDVELTQVAANAALASRAGCNRHRNRPMGLVHPRSSQGQHNR